MAPVLSRRCDAESSEQGRECVTREVSTTSHVPMSSPCRDGVGSRSDDQTHRSDSVPGLVSAFGRILDHDDHLARARTTESRALNGRSCPRAGGSTDPGNVEGSALPRVWRGGRFARSGPGRRLGESDVHVGLKSPASPRRDWCRAVQSVAGESVRHTRRRCKASLTACSEGTIGGGFRRGSVGPLWPARSRSSLSWSSRGAARRAHRRRARPPECVARWRRC